MNIDKRKKKDYNKFKFSVKCDEGIKRFRREFQRAGGWCEPVHN